MPTTKPIAARFQREASEPGFAEDRPVERADPHGSKVDRDRRRREHHRHDRDRACNERRGGDAGPAACDAPENAGEHDAGDERRIRSVVADIGVVKRKRRDAGERAERVEVRCAVAKRGRRDADEERADIDGGEAGQEEELGGRRRRIVHLADEEAPDKARRDAADREPSPFADARHAEDGGGDGENMEHDREGRRRGARDEKRRGIAAERSERRESRPVDDGEEERDETGDGQKDESGTGADEAVERVRGVDRGKERDAGGAGQDRRNVRLGEDLGQGERPVAAPEPLAGHEEHDGEQDAERDARRGSEQTLLDRIAHQEDGAERQRQPADQNRPARADLRFERFAGWHRLRQLWRRGSAGSSAAGASASAGGAWAASAGSGGIAAETAGMRLDGRGLRHGRDRRFGKGRHVRLGDARRRGSRGFRGIDSGSALQRFDSPQKLVARRLARSALASAKIGPTTNQMTTRTRSPHTPHSPDGRPAATYS